MERLRRVIQHLIKMDDDVDVVRLTWYTPPGYTNMKFNFIDIHIDTPEGIVVLTSDYKGGDHVGLDGFTLFIGGDVVLPSDELSYSVYPQAALGGVIFTIKLHKSNERFTFVFEYNDGAYSCSYLNPIVDWLLELDKPI